MLCIIADTIDGQTMLFYDEPTSEVSFGFRYQKHPKLSSPSTTGVGGAQTVVSRWDERTVFINTHEVSDLLKEKSKTMRCETVGAESSCAVS